MQKSSYFVLLFIIPHFFWSQQIQKDSLDRRDIYPKFEAKELIIPAVTLGYGFLALENKGLINLNESINEKFAGKKETSVDDFFVYIPAVTTFAVDLFTHKAQHRFMDRTFILFTAAAINNGVTFGLKSITNERRPNEDKYNSFPSGHTSNAFVSAEFLRQEFKDVSPWYGIGGYAMAFTTAYLRLYNNKHWFSDVVAGAGLGILSTKVAYWIYPWFKYKVFKSKKNKIDAMAIPFFDGQEAQLGLFFQF